MTNWRLDGAWPNVLKQDKSNAMQNKKYLNSLAVVVHKNEPNAGGSSEKVVHP